MVGLVCFQWDENKWKGKETVAPTKKKSLSRERPRASSPHHEKSQRFFQQMEYNSSPSSPPPRKSLSHASGCAPVVPTTKKSTFLLTACKGISKAGLRQTPPADRTMKKLETYFLTNPNPRISKRHPRWPDDEKLQTHFLKKTISRLSEKEFRELAYCLTNPSEKI